ncbi:MAG TPA: hypothetical protein VFI65_08400 [Streptosporangiaceae bacterium]|nr:hypothetical protein [Streptosporangiaceae bacterium]
MSFGFEFELLIPVFALKGGQTEPPDYVRVPRPRAQQGATILSPKIGTANDGTFVASIEHQDRLNKHKSATWPAGEHMTSLEIATEPIDETVLSSVQVAQYVQGIAAWATALHAAVIGGAQLIDGYLTPLVANANHAGPAPWLPNDAVVSASASVQETYGLRLDQVVPEFAGRAADVPAVLQPSLPWYMALKAASYTAAGAETSRALGLVGDLGSQQATDELRGLFALIRYYSAMLSRTKKAAGLQKNRVGVFYYKTALSTVCTDLGQKYRLISRFLATEANRQAVCQILVPDPELQDWGLNVLAGTSDSFFENSMNPWSEELHAPHLGPANNQSVGVVVENRQFRFTYPELIVGGIDQTKTYPPSDWAGFATRLYDRLRKTHGL